MAAKKEETPDPVIEALTKRVAALEREIRKQGDRHKMIRGEAAE